MQVYDENAPLPTHPKLSVRHSRSISQLASSIRGLKPLRELSPNVGGAPTTPTGPIDSEVGLGSSKISKPELAKHVQQVKKLEIKVNGVDRKVIDLLNRVSSLEIDIQHLQAIELSVIPPRPENAAPRPPNIKLPSTSDTKAALFATDDISTPFTPSKTVDLPSPPVLTAIASPPVPAIVARRKALKRMSLLDAGMRGVSIVCPSPLSFQGWSMSVDNVDEGESTEGALDAGNVGKESDLADEREHPALGGEASREMRATSLMDLDEGVVDLVALSPAKPPPADKPAIPADAKPSPSDERVTELEARLAVVEAVSTRATSELVSLASECKRLRQSEMMQEDINRQLLLKVSELRGAISTLTAATTASLLRQDPSSNAKAAAFSSPDDLDAGRMDELAAEVDAMRVGTTIEDPTAGPPHAASLNDTTRRSATTTFALLAVAVALAGCAVLAPTLLRPA